MADENVTYDRAFRGPMVTFTAADAFIGEKLAAICAMDPSAAGGVSQVSVSHPPVAGDEPIPNLFETGWEEVHAVEPGFCVYFTDGRVGRPWRITARSSENCLRLRIPFAGQAHFDSPQTARISDVASRCTFIIQPAGGSLTGVYREGAEYRFCALNLSQSFLLEGLGLTDDELPGQLVNGWQEQETSFGYIELDRAPLSTAARFFGLAAEGAWRRAEVKAIAFDLLHQIFEAWNEGRCGAAAPIRLRPSERQQLERLRRIAEARSPQPMSIAEATELSGLNKNKVHIGFRQVYGMSLHDYCFELRMQRARRMLQETNLPVVHIAAAVGFSEPTNFTAAYRKHFATLPSQARGSDAARAMARGVVPFPSQWAKPAP